NRRSVRETTIGRKDSVLGRLQFRPKRYAEADGAGSPSQRRSIGVNRPYLFRKSGPLQSREPRNRIRSAAVPPSTINSQLSTCPAGLFPSRPRYRFVEQLDLKANC